MRSVAALKKQVARLTREAKRGQPQEVTYTTCWGDEKPDDWEEGVRQGRYIETHWGTEALEEADDSDA